MTRFGVDASGWLNRRGYGRFTRNAVRALIEREDGETYVLFTDDHTADAAELPSAERHVVRLRRPPVEAAAANSARAPADLLRLTAAVRRERLDAFLFPALQTYFPVVGVPTVVGLHDAIPEQLPHLTMPARRARAFWRLKQAVAVRRAARLFTVSEAARAALTAALSLRPEQLAIVPEAPDPAFRPRSAQEVAAGRARVGLPPDEPYVLYAGGISPHKDVETLVDAFAEVAIGRLVLVGDLEAETYVSAAASVRERIARRGAGASVLLPGFVDDDTLAALYTGAAAVANPSLAEGFGLPAVEAAACGAPLVLSDLPAHRETVDGGALYFPPRDAHALAASLRTLLTEPAVATDVARRARRAVDGRTWSTAAERLRELLGAAAGPTVTEAP